MAKIQNDAMLDAGLQYVIDNTNRLFICATASTGTTYDSAKTAALASVAIVSTLFTIGDGDTSGRKVTLAIVSGVSVTTTGSATHAVLAQKSAGASAMVYVTQTSVKALTAGDTLNTTAFDIELRDPT
jgi:hypothetical protein